MVYASCSFVIGPVTKQSKRNLPPIREYMTMLARIVADEQFVARFAPEDRFQNPAKVDGTITYEASDSSIVTFEDRGDGSTLVKATGKIGTTRITATADADLGDGVKNITGILDVEVLAAEAVSFAISVEAPTKQPLPEPSNG